MTRASSGRAITRDDGRTPAQWYCLLAGLSLLLAGVLGFGAVDGLVAIIGLIDGEDVLGLIPINAADNALHVALAALGIITGLISREDAGSARRASGHSRSARRARMRATRRGRLSETN